MRDRETGDGKHPLTASLDSKYQDHLATAGREYFMPKAMVIQF